MHGGRAQTLSLINFPRPTVLGKLKGPSSEIPVKLLLGRGTKYNISWYFFLISEAPPCLQHRRIPLNHLSTLPQSNTGDAGMRTKDWHFGYFLHRWVKTWQYLWNGYADLNCDSVNRYGVSRHRQQGDMPRDILRVIT